MLFCLSPTLNPVTRGPKEGDPGGSLPRMQCGRSCPSRPPTKLQRRLESCAHRPHAWSPAKDSAHSCLGAAPLPGTRGRCRPAVVAMVTAGGGVGFT